MSRIRATGTQLEEKVFKHLQRKKIYFQKHYRKAVGNPDIALPRKKKAVFIDGDFWHGWKFKERSKRLPRKYWRKKIESNIKRDERNKRMLKWQGWKVLRVWEHELKKNEDKALKKIKEFLQND